MGPLASEKALNLLLDQIKLASNDGGKVVFGGGRIDRPGFYLEPAVLTGVTEENAIHAQDLFGPVASFRIVENANEAIRLANATPFSLDALVFTADSRAGRKVAAKIESGMVFINRAVRDGRPTSFPWSQEFGFWP